MTNRGPGACQIIFLIRSFLIPDLVDPKGLTDQPMVFLPAMYLANVDAIEVNMYLSDRDKRLQSIAYGALLTDGSHTYSPLSPYFYKPTKT